MSSAVRLAETGFAVEIDQPTRSRSHRFGRGRRSPAIRRSFRCAGSSWWYQIRGLIGVTVSWGCADEVLALVRALR